MTPHHVSLTARSSAIALLLGASAAAAAGIDTAWIHFLDGPASQGDGGVAIAIGPDSSVYVAGTVVVHGLDIDVPRFHTVKYSADGELLWERSYVQAERSAAYHIAVDPAGDVLVLGTSNFDYDWGLVKYDADGDMLWSRTYASASFFLDNPVALLVDGVRNSYIHGPDYSESLGVSHVTTRKYDAAGTLLWSRAFMGANLGSYGTAMSFAPDGGLYLAGGVVEPGVGTQFAVTRLDDSGNTQWSRTSGYAGSATLDMAQDVAADSQGNAVATGFHGGNTAALSDAATTKIAPDGTVLWTRIYNSPFNRNDRGQKVAVDPQDNIVVAMSSEEAGQTVDVVVAGYGPDGEPLWTLRYGVPGGSDFVDALEVGADSRVYIAGRRGSFDGFVLCISPGGEIEWEQLFTGPSGGAARARALAIFDDGSIGATGEAAVPGRGNDMTTMRLVPQTPVAGDLDGDGDVDTTDLNILLSDFGCTAGPGNCAGDADGDGDTDTTDLNIVLSNFGQTG